MSESSIHDIAKKKKDACASFPVLPQIAKVTATASDKCLGKALICGVQYTLRFQVVTGRVSEHIPQV